jgi:hypothetical protein
VLRTGGRRLCRALPFIAVAALFLVAVAAATNPQTYPDPVDTDPGPDVTSVTVSNDDAGTVTIRMDLANRPTGLGANDNIYVYVNTDRNVSTGCNGSEYRIYAFGSPLRFGIDPCVNNDFPDTGPCCGSFSNGGITWTIPAESIGHSTNFWFWVATAVAGHFDPPAGDLVPDVDPSGAPLQYDAGKKLTLTLNGAGSGTVTSPARNLECGSSCSATFPTGTSVVLSAHASPGSKFAGWSGDCSGKGTCTVTMDGDHSVTATFVPRVLHMRAQIADLPHNLLGILGTTVTWFKSFVVTKAPPGAKVVFRCCGKHETRHANAAGRATSRLVSGGKAGTRRFHAGDHIVVSLSKAHYFPCTLHVTVRVVDYTVRRSC